MTASAMSMYIMTDAQLNHQGFLLDDLEAILTHLCRHL
jgi:hypothetical protein